MDTTFTPPAPYGPERTLKRLLDRAASEAVGAGALFTLLRPYLSLDGYEKALAHLTSLEAATATAKSAWLAATLTPETPMVTPAQRQELLAVLHDPRISASEREELLLELPRRSAESASALLLSLKLDINERAGDAVFPEVGTYGVQPLTLTSFVGSTAQPA